MSSIQSVFFRRYLQTRLKPMLRRTSIPELRAGMKRMERLDSKWTLPRHAVAYPVQAGGVPSEWLYWQGGVAPPVLLYIHGGGWVVGSPRTHRGLVLGLLRHAGGRALSLDYRLAPEYPYPAALEDCLAAYHWLLSTGFQPKDIVIGGDSAGGNLALATLLSLRSQDPALLPAAAVTFSPATDLAGHYDTALAQKDPLLPYEAVAAWLTAYVGPHDRRAPLISPLYGDLHGLPPLLIQVGSDEMLLPACEALAARARAAGVDVTYQVWPKMWHVFQVFAPYLPEARRALKNAAQFIKQKVG